MELTAGDYFYSSEWHKGKDPSVECTVDLTLTASTQVKCIIVNTELFRHRLLLARILDKMIESSNFRSKKEPS
jgi:hypothetical protein